ncbi:MAG: branched-chain amino acid ABC transporter permease [Bacillati bacterium ANGP1]|uniref:Branched-chain amino acid ABC transporter permease n=1 Tax=Candidatus Segetimicrobium genomatis TaxID=2569760 RepID=A0A537KDM0_9BACT|nr:MAG: branched-chain amino acid ABC transporter permease [Terrabacteria group bacterium ANGP1]
MTLHDVVLQQIINGLSLGAMYSLLALGFTMVYGIIELINFAHFNIFMVGSFIAMFALQALGLHGQSRLLTGWPLVGALSLGFSSTMLASGGIGVVIERVALRPMRNVKGTAAMITTIGVSYILFNIILLTTGAGSQNYPNPMPQISWHIGGAVLRLREVLLWSVSLVLMAVLHMFVQRTKMGKAMRATAQDQEAARMMGVEVDQIVMLTFFIGSALAGAAGLIFGLYYNNTSFLIGYTAGLRAFTAAVLGGIGNIVGAMMGGLIIGLIEALGGQFLQVRWTDVIIFSILIVVLALRPTGLLGLSTPKKS